MLAALHPNGLNKQRVGEQSKYDENPPDDASKFFMRVFFFSEEEAGKEHIEKGFTPRENHDGLVTL
ncbi:MAG: hypothetical protein E5Y79_09870 [Mesorhizobium sp.]|uniref:hypothetical protein n=1 Tax=Mesorhizobium sp. TaxID=1871066 RepID=UPI0012061195|nr:hypothetical protein [Mesorhizobium sp.]TIL60566.1 MAG: hypothetical protein E5Y79_09870 [Mesorhizobium sp.]